MINRDEIKIIALKNLYDCKIHGFPINIKFIIYSLGYKFISIQELMKKGLLNQSDILNIKDLGIVCLDNEGKPRMCYSDKSSKSEIRWILAHELGHVVLGHIIKDENGYIKFKDGNKKVFEEEAELFARYILAPELLLLTFGANTPKKIVNSFNIPAKNAMKIFSDIKIKNYTNFPELELPIIGLMYESLKLQHYEFSAELEVSKI